MFTSIPTSVRQRIGWKSSLLGDPKDDVYITRHYRPQTYSLDEAIEFHRLTHQPCMFDQPTAFLYLSLELNMLINERKVLDPFDGIIRMPNTFDDGINKTLLVFCKNVADQENALKAGATLVGSLPLIKKIQAAEVSLSEYRYVAAHPDILSEVASIRGLLKKRFPNRQKGSLDVDIMKMVDYFINGTEYASQTDPVQHDFGWVDVPVGRLNMSNEQLINNIEATVQVVSSQKSKKQSGPFITGAILYSPPSSDRFVVDVSQMQSVEVEEEESDTN